MPTHQQKKVGGLLNPRVHVFCDETGNFVHRPGDKHALTGLVFIEADVRRIREVAKRYAAEAVLDHKGKVDTRATIEGRTRLVEEVVDELRQLGVTLFKAPYDCNVETSSQLADAICGTAPSDDSARAIAKAWGTDADPETLGIVMQESGLIGAIEAASTDLSPGDQHNPHVLDTLSRLRVLGRQNPIYLRLHYETNRELAKWFHTRGILPSLDICFEYGKFIEGDEEVANLICRFSFHLEYMHERRSHARQWFGLHASRFRSSLGRWNVRPELLLADLHAYLVGADLNGRGDVEFHRRLLARFVEPPGESLHDC